MEEMMNTTGGNAAMGGIGSMAPPEQAAALAAFRNTDKGTLVRDLNSAVNDVAPGAVQGIVAELRKMGFDAEDVDNWVEILDEMIEDPAEYVTSRQQLIQQGMDPEFLPETFDYEYLVGLRMAFEALRDEVAMMPAMPVQNFAEGGIAELRPIAQAMAKMGRGGDTILAHINPQEAQLLKAMGGSGTINPYTGLPEFIFKAISKPFKSVGKAVGGAVKGVVNGVKSFVKSDIGRIVTTIGLTMLAGPAASALLGSTAPAWAVTALAAGMGGAGATLLAGGNIKDALKSGLTSAVVAGVGSGVTQGFDATYAGPQTYGELFGTTPTSAAGTGGPYDIQDSPFSNFDAPATPVTTADVSATRGVITPSTVSAAPPVSGGAQYSFESPGFIEGASNQSGFTQGQLLASEMGDYAPPLRYTSPPPTPAAPAASQFAPTLNVDGTTTAYLGRAPIDPATGMPPQVNYNTGFDSRLAAGNIGEGVPTITDTNFTGAQGPSFYDQAKSTLSRGYEGAKDIYSEYISPDRGMPTSSEIGVRANEIRSQVPGISADKAYDLAAKELTPGTISRYAPIAGIGLGVASLSGGFTPEPPPEPSLVRGPTGIELYESDPEQYRPNIYGGQTPVTYQPFNPELYAAQQYGAYNPFFFQPRSRYGAPQQPVYRAQGGITETSKFKRKIGAINGPGTEKSDDIPAMLSDGEFVFTARAVRGMGNGSRRKGAKAMYRLMKMLEKKVEGRR